MISREGISLDPVNMGYKGKFRCTGWEIRCDAFVPNKQAQSNELTSIVCALSWSLASNLVEAGQVDACQYHNLPATIISMESASERQKGSTGGRRIETTPDVYGLRQRHLPIRNKTCH
jgi:hypothetical protein